MKRCSWRTVSIAVSRRTVDVSVGRHRQDPKNIEHVLWAHGFNQNMNLDHAIARRTDDRWPVRLVKGMSKEQLKTRFAYIRTPEELRRIFRAATQQRGDSEGGGDGSEAVFWRNGPWMVILEKGKAVDLVLCKGY